MIPFYRGGSRGTERLSNLPKVSELVSSGAGSKWDPAKGVPLAPSCVSSSIPSPRVSLLGRRAQACLLSSHTVIHSTRVSQGVAPGSAVSASPGDLLEMHVLSPPPEELNQDLRSGTQHLDFNQLSR